MATVEEYEAFVASWPHIRTAVDSRVDALEARLAPQATVAKPVDGLTSDSQARIAINALIDRLTVAGILE